MISFNAWAMIQFPRLRIGVGRPPGRMDVTAWVLGRFREDEKEDIEHAVVRAADSVENLGRRRNRADHG